MKLRFLIALMFVSTPALAERLEFDHRLYPPLQQVLDSGDKDMVDFENKNPSRLVDLIAIKGKSARNWTEALEILSIPRPGDVQDAQGWMVLLQGQAQARCAATFNVIARDENSVTYERRSPNCPAERASHALYRLVAGKRSWFQLSVLVKGELEPGARAQWLTLLASAHLR